MASNLGLLIGFFLGLVRLPVVLLYAWNAGQCQARKLINVAPGTRLLSAKGAKRY
jgi:hypothetical protein